MEKWNIPNAEQAASVNFHSWPIRFALIKGMMRSSMISGRVHTMSPKQLLEADTVGHSLSSSSSIFLRRKDRMKKKQNSRKKK